MKYGRENKYYAINPFFHIGILPEALIRVLVLKQYIKVQIIINTLFLQIKITPASSPILDMNKCTLEQIPNNSMIMNNLHGQ